jgi:hypothetical protein
MQWAICNVEGAISMGKSTKSTKSPYIDKYHTSTRFISSKCIERKSIFDPKILKSIFLHFICL